AGARRRSHSIADGSQGARQSRRRTVRHAQRSAMIARKIAAAAAALLAAAALAAAGPYTTRLSPQDLHHIKTVAVIPVLGNSFLFRHVKNSPFEWLGPPDSHFLEISDWGL